MRKIKARDLLNKPFEEILAMPEERFILVFDDGELETNNRRTNFSHLLWDIHRQYDRTPLLIKHHIGDARASNGIALDTLEHCLWSCHEAYPELNWQQEEHLWVLVSNMTNEVYNFIVEHLSPYVASSSILDIIDVLDHPEVKAANEGIVDKMKAGSLDPIGETIAEVKAVVMNPDNFKLNPFVSAMHTGAVKANQAMQIVAPIGNKTDHDSFIFDYPIIGSFGSGMRNITELGIESRSATKALLSSKKGLPDTEYANRRLQLSCSIIDKVHKGDCGSTSYLDWKVTKQNFKFIIGKYYLTEDNSLRPIKSDSNHLIGQWVKLRTVFGCIHHDKHGVCSMCLGDISHSVPHGTNLGHVAATQLGEQVSQAVLSIKHLDSSANAMDITLGPQEMKVFKTDRRRPVLKLADGMKGYNIKMAFHLEEVANISDIRQVSSVKQLAISGVTSISQVEVTIEKGGVEQVMLLNVCAGDRMASMTHEFLEHVRNIWFESVSTSGMSIDLKGWDLKKPIFELPMKHMSMIDYMGCVIAMISSSSGKSGSRKNNNFGGKEIKRLTDFDTPEEALTEFFELISAKLTVNLAYLECIIHSLRVNSVEDDDYDLPNRGTKGSIARYNDALALRSAGGMMAYQGHQRFLISPSSFTVRKRPPHLLDPVFMPE